MRFMLLLALAMFGKTVLADAPEFLKDAKRVLFLGDSITYAGHYVDVVDATFRSAGLSTEVINLGLPSETCSGLSEPDHPFPRPDVHERLDRALSMIQPDVVVACYGMNDGIYHPLQDDRLDSYKKGMDRLVTKVVASGAKLVLMTPPPFDRVALEGTGKLVPIDSPEFGFKKVYEDYDSVLQAYAQHVREQSGRVEMVIDLHAAVSEYLRDRRKADATFVMSGDGIHLNEAGHEVVAGAILAAWGLGDQSRPSDESLSRVIAVHNLMDPAWLTHVGHKRPGIKRGLSLAEARAKAGLESPVHPE